MTFSCNLFCNQGKAFKGNILGREGVKTSLLNASQSACSSRCRCVGVSSLWPMTDDVGFGNLARCWSLGQFDAPAWRRK